MQNHKQLQRQWFTIKKPQKWDIESPFLYQLKTSIIEDGKPTDEIFTTFGIRTFQLTADDGFILNGRRVQLHGVNLHHDQGLLGAKFNRRAMQRQLEIMKENGLQCHPHKPQYGCARIAAIVRQYGFAGFQRSFRQMGQKSRFSAGNGF